MRHIRAKGVINMVAGVNDSVGHKVIQVIDGTHWKAMFTQPPTVRGYQALRHCRRVGGLASEFEADLE